MRCIWEDRQGCDETLSVESAAGLVGRELGRGPLQEGAAGWGHRDGSTNVKCGAIAEY